MSEERPEQVDQEFFVALINADMKTLDRVVSRDFLMIDVMTGSEVSKAALLEAIESRSLRFNHIDRAELKVRDFGKTAVITGRTKMFGSYAGQPFRVNSRYSHVFVRCDDHWEMVSAQGTQIAPTSPGHQTQ